jgi:hypothetical protein
MLRLNISNKILKWIKNSYTIDRTYIFEGSKNELIQLLKESALNKYKIKFSMSTLNDDDFIITDPFPVGTMLINYMPSKGLSLYGSMKIIDSSHLSIRLKTKIRFESYLLFLISIVAILIIVLNIKTIPFWIILFPIITPFWFIWIFMIQYEGLENKARMYLNIKEILLQSGSGIVAR